MTRAARLRIVSIDTPKADSRSLFRMPGTPHARRSKLATAYTMPADHPSTFLASGYPAPATRRERLQRALVQLRVRVRGEEPAQMLLRGLLKARGFCVHGGAPARHCTRQVKSVLVSARRR